MRCKWSDISKYRGELFGIAIISVIILHYLGTLHSGETNRILYMFARFYNGAVGSVGVDIFVFLSGYGIFYSLCKKEPLSKFFQKRFQRVLFPYLVLGLFFWTIKDLKAFSAIGAYSLEIYVIHIAVRNLMGTLQFDLRNPLIYLLHLAIVIPLVRCFVMLQKVRLFKE